MSLKFQMAGSQSMSGIAEFQLIERLSAQAAARLNVLMKDLVKSHLAATG